VSKTQLVLWVLSILFVIAIIVWWVAIFIRWRAYRYEGGELRLWEVDDGGEYALFFAAADELDAVAQYRRKYGDEVLGVEASEVPAFVHIPFIMPGLSLEPEVRTAREWAQIGRGFIGRIRR